METRRDEIQRRLGAIRRDFSFNVRRMYHALQVGDRRVDLGQPVAGSETLSTWYWRELTSVDVGAIATQLGYRILVTKFLCSRERVAASAALEQFYKNPELPAPARPAVVARAIQLGVQEKAFGLAELRGDEIDPATLKYGEEIPLDAVTFEVGIYLVSKEKCETIRAQMAATEGPETGTEVSPTPGEAEVPTPTIDTGAGVPGTGVVTLPVEGFERVRLVVSGIPASKIADVNRGILMPISRAVGDFEFTLEIDVSGAEGLSQATLENQVKETIQQIGASIRDEVLE